MWAEEQPPWNTQAASEETSQFLHMSSACTSTVVYLCTCSKSQISLYLCTCITAYQRHHTRCTRVLKNCLKRQRASLIYNRKYKYSISVKVHHRKIQVILGSNTKITTVKLRTEAPGFYQLQKHLMILLRYDDDLWYVVKQLTITLRYSKIAYYY